MNPIKLNFINFNLLRFSKIKYISFENRNFQRKISKNDPLTKIWSQMEIEMAWSHDAHTQPNQTSIHEEYFPCDTFSYQRRFVNDKYFERDPRYKKSRCPWDGIYLRTSIMFQTGGKSSIWFPPEGLVELHVRINSFIHEINSTHQLSKK